MLKILFLVSYLPIGLAAYLLVSLINKDIKGDSESGTFIVLFWFIALPVLLVYLFLTGIKKAVELLDKEL